MWYLTKKMQSVSRKRKCKVLVDKEIRKCKGWAEKENGKCW